MFNLITVDVELSFISHRAAGLGSDSTVYLFYFNLCLNNFRSQQKFIMGIFRLTAAAAFDVREDYRIRVAPLHVQTPGLCKTRELFRINFPWF